MVRLPKALFESRGQRPLVQREDGKGGRVSEVTLTMHCTRRQPRIVHTKKKEKLIKRELLSFWIGSLRGL